MLAEERGVSAPSTEDQHRWPTFVVVFAATLTVACLKEAKPFYYDAGAYWSLANAFRDGGGFSLLNFDDPARGYVFPLVALALGDLADTLDWRDVTAVRVFNSLVFALIATTLAPKVAELTWPGRRWGAWPRLTLAAVLVVFWGGHLGFPLSDFPALALALLALIAVGRADSRRWTFVAGLATGAAINVRPAYLLLLPAVSLLIAMAWWSRGDGSRYSWQRRLLLASLFTAGFALVSFPQSLSAHRHHDTWSFVPGAAAKLSSFQFTAGLQMQRYDTFVGTDGGVPPRLIYDDPVGPSVLAEEGWAIESPREYISIVIDHPVDMAGVFTRHIVNGLDHRYSGPYIETFNSNANRPMRTVGFLLVFLALVRVTWPAARRTLSPARWRYPAALLACGLPAVTSAVETRFMLPVFLVSCIVVLAPGWTSSSLRSSLRRRRTLIPVALVVAYVLSMVAVFYVTEEAVEHLRVEDAVEKSAP